MDGSGRAGLPDIQAQHDDRKLAIDTAGVRGLRLPLTVEGASGPQATIAHATLTVAVPAQAKGTHMSRFVELMETQESPLTPASFERLVRRMLVRLDARAGEIRLRFPYFTEKRAPVSGVRSRLDHDVRWTGKIDDRGYSFRMAVTVAATSLCPCSKEISAYGAHNQRSHIDIEVTLGAPMTIEELIGVAERAASCELYGLLKRPDEKFVTERAYDNPRFVEDLVREVALALRADRRVRSFQVEAENFESIHNHSAVALIASG